MHQCRSCGADFTISDIERDLRARLAPEFAGRRCDIPDPTLCPDCRWQRRLSYRDERTLFSRKCDYSGRGIISMFPADAPFPVYYIKDWLSDVWDPMEFGREFDFKRPFFEQFHEMRTQMPHFNLFVDPDQDENSEYTNCATESKNCYLISQAERNEDCYYCRGVHACINCVDCLRIDHCELCYECINASNCYNCVHCKDCSGSSDCYFSSSLRGCSNCFGCHGLTQKKYYWFNEPLGREKWEQRFAELTFSRSEMRSSIKKAEQVRLNLPHRFAHVVQCQNSTGDHITHCRDAWNCYDSQNLENCGHCSELQGGAKYCLDYSCWGIDAELLYECMGCGTGAYGNLFTMHCWQSVHNLLYCDSCFPAVSNCFGCFGIRRGKYCIMNQQFSEQDYNALVPRIIAHMRETGEWGEFFPAELSPHGYNETIAGEYFPLSREQAAQRSWNWRDDMHGSPHSVSCREIPETIEEADQSITKEVLGCASSGTPYRITAQEFKFYKKMGLPLPDEHFHQRHLARVARRNPRKLASRCCEHCGVEIQSTFPVAQPEIVFCEACYLEQVS